jgi:ferredoxin, 2Fe-2S
VVECGNHGDFVIRKIWKSLFAGTCKNASSPRDELSVMVGDHETVRIQLAEKPASSILELILKNQVEISHSCGGMGTCGTCRVEVIEGSARLESPNEVECEIAEERGFREGERLACQTRVVPGLKIRVPSFSEDQSR